VRWAKTFGMTHPMHPSNGLPQALERLHCRKQPQDDPEPTGFFSASMRTASLLNLLHISSSSCKRSMF
jgi:hypothetical protein